MKLSIASSLFVHYSIWDAVSLVAESGFDGIDIWGGRPHIYRQDYNEGELKDLRSLIEEHGLEVSSFMPAFFRYPYSLSSPNEIVRQDSLEYMRQCINNAVILGAPILLIIPGHSLFRQNLRDARNRMIDSIEAICRYALQYDIRLGIEPANRAITDLVNTASDAMEIIQELRYENLGIVLDSGHINLSAEKPEEAVRRAGDRLLQVHINDNDGKRQQNLIPGEGNFDFMVLLAALAEVNFRGYLTVELAWDYTLNPQPAAVISAERMRTRLH